jgi:hypothetical protein
VEKRNIYPQRACCDRVNYGKKYLTADFCTKYANNEIIYVLVFSVVRPSKKLPQALA